MHNLSFAYALSLDVKNQNFERSKILDNSNQGGWGWSVSLNECKFEHIERSIHFESFNDECAIVKEAQDRNLLSQQ